MNHPFVYLRVLRHVEHTVFAVTTGQKFYYDNQFSRKIAYSSGQQVKRSILEELCTNLNTIPAPTTFNWQVDKSGKPEQKEPHSICDPTYPDQLLGGYMMAQSKKAAGKKKEEAEDGEEKKEETFTIKRRSPLSISAMRPLHPLLGGLEERTEAMTFDRTSHPERHPVKIRTTDGKELKGDDLEAFLNSLETLGRNLPNRAWLKPQSRATGLFIFDLAIDLRTLFCVSLNKQEPELAKEIEVKLREAGWKESKNIFGKCLVCPPNERTNLINALAHSLLNWRITSNQSRTFSLMETLAVAISTNANRIPAAIRAELSEEDTNRAIPVIDNNIGADVFITLPCRGYVAGVTGAVDALEKAESKLIELLSSFNYENQLQPV